MACTELPAARGSRPGMSTDGVGSSDNARSLRRVQDDAATKNRARCAAIVEVGTEARPRASVRAPIVHAIKINSRVPTSSRTSGPRFQSSGPTRQGYGLGTRLCVPMAPCWSSPGRERCVDGGLGAQPVSQLTNPVRTRIVGRRCGVQSAPVFQTVAFVSGPHARTE